MRRPLRRMGRTLEVAGSAPMTEPTQGTSRRDLRFVAPTPAAAPPERHGRRASETETRALWRTAAWAAHRRPSAPVEPSIGHRLRPDRPKGAPGRLLSPIRRLYHTCRRDGQIGARVGCTTWEGRVPAPASQRSHASTNLRRPLSRPATHTLRESSCAIRPIPSQYNPLFPRPDPRPNVPHPTHPSQTSSQTGPRNHLPLCHTSPHAPPHPSARPPSRPPALSLWARRRPSVTDRPRFVFSCLITVTHTNLPYPPCDLVARTLRTNTLPNSANFIH